MSEKTSSIIHESVKIDGSVYQIIRGYTTPIKQQIMDGGGVWSDKRLRWEVPGRVLPQSIRDAIKGTASLDTATPIVETVEVKTKHGTFCRGDKVRVTSHGNRTGTITSFVSMNTHAVLDLYSYGEKAHVVPVGDLRHDRKPEDMEAALADLAETTPEPAPVAETPVIAEIEIAQPVISAQPKFKLGQPVKHKELKYTGVVTSTFDNGSVMVNVADFSGKSVVYFVSQYREIDLELLDTALPIRQVEFLIALSIGGEVKKNASTRQALRRYGLITHTDEWEKIELTPAGHGWLKYVAHVPDQPKRESNVSEIPNSSNERPIMPVSSAAWRTIKLGSTVYATQDIHAGGVVIVNAGDKGAVETRGERALNVLFENSKSGSLHHVLCTWEMVTKVASEQAAPVSAPVSTKPDMKAIVDKNIREMLAEKLEADGSQMEYAIEARYGVQQGEDWLTFNQSEPAPNPAKPTIVLKTHEGDVTIEAKIFGQLAIHHSLLNNSQPNPNKWTLTHIKSGMSLFDRHSKMGDLVVLAERVSGIDVDTWVANGAKDEEIRDQLKAIRHVWVKEYRNSHYD